MEAIDRKLRSHYINYELNQAPYNKFINTIFVIIFAYTLGLAFIFIAHNILPPKYYYDANTIKRFMVYATEFLPLNSYNNTAFFYKLLGFNFSTSLLYGGIFTYTLAFVLLFLNLNMGKISLNRNFIYLFTGWILIASIYLGQFSKEITIVMLSSILLYFAKLNKNKFIFPLIVFISLYAYYFRMYWFIILYFLILFYFFDKKRGWIKYVFILSGILFMFFLASLKGIYFTNAREIVNVNRIGSIDAQTIILNIFPNTNFIFDFLNSTTVFLIFFLPVSIIVKLNIKYILFFLWELLNIWFFIKATNFIFNHKFSLPRYIFNRAKFSIYLIITFTMTQSLFEPDYGSFLKHQIGIISLHLYLLSNYFHFKKRI